VKADIKLSDNLTGLLLFVFVISWITLISILYDGTPDLYDVLLNRISDGQVEIPASKGSNSTVPEFKCK